MKRVKFKIQSDSRPDSIKRDINEAEILESLDQLSTSPSLVNRFLNSVSEISMTTMADLFQEARSGYVGDLIDMFIRIEASDSRIRGMVSSRRVASSKSGYIVKNGSDSDTAREAAVMVEDNIKHLNFLNIKKEIINGRFYGVNILENVWAKSIDGKLFIDDVRRVDHKRIRQFNQIDMAATRGDMYKKYGKLYLVLDTWDFSGKYMYQDRLFIEDIDPAKLIVATYDNNPSYYDINSIMRPTARWYIIKTELVKFWAQAAEKFGFPIPIAKIPKDDYAKYSHKVRDLLNSVGANRFGVFFKEFEIDFHSVSTPANADVFKSLIEMANAEAAIGILGQNLTSEVRAGSHAAAQSHYKNILMDLIKDDIEWMDEIINEQFVYPLVRKNYPELLEHEYPVYESTLEKEVDIQRLASGLMSLSRLVEIPKSHIYQESMIPKPVEGEDVVGGYRGNSVLDIIEGEVS